MIIAIVSDIHANATAFEAVLNAAKAKNADALMVAGDLVGYYFQPKTVIQLMQSFEKPVYIVRGNHEELLFSAKTCRDQLAKVSAKYGPGIQIALDQLTDLEVDWITSLPHPLEVRYPDCFFLLCHGSPSSIDQYVYPDSPLEELVLSLNEQPDVLIMGHTHYPFIRNVGSCLIINPGSVGQPRNRVPGAHWALLDTQTMSVSLFVEPYNFSDLQQHCLEVAPFHPYLHQVLTRS